MLLDIKSVDFSDVADIVCAASAIVAEFSVQGCVPRPALRSAAKAWVAGAHRALTSLSVGDALAVADCFDVIHRIGFSTAADAHMLAAYKLRAFRACVAGDSSVDVYRLARAIMLELERHNQAFAGAPLDWLAGRVDRWLANFLNANRAEELPTVDCLQQLSILLRANLWVYMPGRQDSFKRQLVSQFLPLVENPDALGPEEAEAADAFLTAALPFIPASRHDALLNAQCLIRNA